MFNRSVLGFSIRFGTVSGGVVLLAALFGRNPPFIMLAFALMAIVGSVLISNRNLPEFKARFAMAFGAATVTCLMFATLLVYARGAAAPVWLHLMNIPVSIMFAAIAGAIIGAITRPWSASIPV